MKILTCHKMFGLQLMEPRKTVISFGETRRRLQVDKNRLISCFTSRQLPVVRVGLSASFICVWLYRYSHWFYEKGWYISARFLWQLNMLITGADISPRSALGEGLLVVHPVAVTIVGTAGKNLTVEGLGGMGGGLSLIDIGAGPGLPILGDYITLTRGAMILGPVKVGCRVKVGPGCTIVRDIDDDMVVLPHEFRVRRQALKANTE